MKNNNQSKQQLGLVDSPAFSTDDTTAYLAKDELAALENTFPSGKPINDDNNSNTFNFGVYRPQVQQQLNYEQWEQKVLREQRENFNNKTSLFQSSPTSSGAPNLVDDGVKPTAEQIEKLRKEESINQLSQRLALLQNSEQRLKKELERNLLVQRQLKDNLNEISQS